MTPSQRRANSTSAEKNRSDTMVRPPHSVVKRGYLTWFAASWNYPHAGGTRPTIANPSGTLMPCPSGQVTWERGTSTSTISTSLQHGMMSANTPPEGCPQEVGLDVLDDGAERAPRQRTVPPARRLAGRQHLAEQPARPHPRP